MDVSGKTWLLLKALRVRPQTSATLLSATDGALPQIDDQCNAFRTSLRRHHHLFEWHHVLIGARSAQSELGGLIFDCANIVVERRIALQAL